MIRELHTHRREGHCGRRLPGLQTSPLCHSFRSTDQPGGVLTGQGVERRREALPVFGHPKARVLPGAPF